MRQGLLKKKNKHSTTIQVSRDTKLGKNKKLKIITYFNNNKEKYNINGLQKQLTISNGIYQRR